MMKNISYFLSAFVILIFAYRSFAQTATFRFSYDAGEFVIAGLNNSFGPYYGNAIKIDNAGKVVWRRKWKFLMEQDPDNIHNKS